MFPQGDRHVPSSAPDVEPFRLEAERVFSTRNVTGQSAPLLPQAVQVTNMLHDSHHHAPPTLHELATTLRSATIFSRLTDP